MEAFFIHGADGLVVALCTCLSRKVFRSATHPTDTRVVYCM